MSASFYDLLKYAATGQASPSMTYFDKMRASTLMGGGTVQTLTGIPPLSFKSNGKPLISWSMKGNGSQTGTPTPDNPVMPTFCGVRTANVMPAGEKKTTVSNGVTFDSDGNGRYHVYGTATGEATAKFILAQGFITPISVSNNGQGTLSFFNNQRLSNVTVAFYNDTTKVDDWVMSPLQRTSTAYNTIGNKYVDNIILRVPSGTQVDMLVTPEFTNDGVLPSEFEPFGYKIPISCGGENLFDSTVYTSGYNIAQGGEIVQNSNYSLSGYIFVTAGTYTLSGKNTYNTTANIANRAILYDVNKENPAVVLDATGAKPVDFDYTIQIPKSGFLVFSFRITDINIMLNLGSTAKPYAPYSRQTTPVYLGEVPTVRKIRKLVLTGSETGWSNVSGNAPYRIMLTDIVSTRDRNSVLFLSSHYLAVSNNTSWAQYNTCVSWAFTGDNINAKCLQFRDKNQATLADFKSYLASEYAAGHPVTIWYVLANEETAIVNEPLCKISTYADELHSTDAGVTIPTVKGDNVLTVDTELQPSEMTITYKG